jgi:hypothetical protein
MSSSDEGASVEADDQPPWLLLLLLLLPSSSPFSSSLPWALAL